MTLRDHCVLGFVGICLWALAFLLGMPSNYFQEWNTVELILLSLVTCFGIAPFIAFVVIILLGRDYLKTGVWLAFYTSVPLAILDFIVLGIIQGKGIGFWASHWYLVLGYIYVWIIGPLVGLSLRKLKKAV